MPRRRFHPYTIRPREIPREHQAGKLRRTRRPYTRQAALGMTVSMLVVALWSSAAWGQKGAGASGDWLPPPTPAEGVSPQTAHSATATAGQDIVSVSVADVLGKLALIGVLIYAGIWGLRQWRERGIPTPHSGRGGLIRVRESVSLGAGGHLYVVEFGSRSLLISAVGDRVQLLTGNAASEMGVLDTSSLPAQGFQQGLFGDVERPHRSTSSHPPQEDYAANGAWLRADNFRRTADWERKRDALVRALQESDQL